MIDRVNPATMWDSTANGHSQISVVEPGRLAFLSGQIGVPSSGEPAPADLVEQAKLISASIHSALMELRASPSDIVLARLYVVDATAERMQAAWSVFLELFDGAMPSATVVGVSALADARLQLELEVVVRLPV